MFSLSSCGPAPTCEPAPAGPHCFGGGALTEVRRPLTGLRLRGLLAPEGVPSVPMTVAAMPWIADHGLPHMPERGFDALREPLEDAAFGALVKDETGSDVTLKRVFPALPGDPFLDPVLDPFLLPASSLRSPAYMSSSTEISLLVRGRSVALLLDVDSEGPLAGFMACVREPEPHRVVADRE